MFRFWFGEQSAWENRAKSLTPLKLLKYLGFLFDISEKTIINQLDHVSKNLFHATAIEME